MSIRFLSTEEQTMFRDSARRWVDQDCVVTADPLKHWTQFAELGWLMIALPEDVGGLGGDAYDAAIIAEELGRGLVRAPYVEIAVTTAQLLLAIQPDQVAAIAAGDARPLLAHDEAGARGDPAWVETQAVRMSGGWRLTGRKTGIVGAPFADRFLVSACTDSGIALFAIDAMDAPICTYASIDDRPAAELRLQDTSAELIAQDVLPAIQRALDHALIVESAEALGTMQVALDLARNYLLTRKQYGQLIGDFQALRHRLADMFIEVEQARSMILRGLAALVENGSDRSAMAAAVRVRVAQAASFVGAHAIQLHGGIGVTEEYTVGRHFKRLLAFQSRHGTAAGQVDRYMALTAASREV